jgi:hypothetical protein
MIMPTFDQEQRPVVISVPPPTSLEVEYYKTIVRIIIITNVSSNRVLIEDVVLRFQSNDAQGALNVKVDCGWELASGVSREVKIQITPDPLYKDATNTFDVRVGYRVTNNNQLGKVQYEVYSKQSYIIVREPKIHVGRVFISLKQPEDLHLGQIMAQMARRAGLTPFLKDDNQRLSEDIWKETIEPALRSSDVCIVIWTDNTNWKADGVEREIKMCRDPNKPKIPEALFLEQNTPTPELYLNTSIEWTHFDAKDPGKAFAHGADGLRSRLQNHK